MILKFHDDLNNSNILFTLGNQYCFNKKRLQVLSIQHAIIANNLSIDGISVGHYKPCGLLKYYPRGSLKCSQCNKTKSINSKNPSYLCTGYYECLLGCRLICNDCRNRINTHDILRFCTKFILTNYDIIKDIRKEANNRLQLNKEKKALSIIKPYMMHWAYKPNGPCYRVLLKQYSNVS